MAEKLGRVEVVLEGQAEQDVLRFNLETVTPIDHKGAPQGTPIFRRITFVTRVMHGMHDATSWVVNEPRAPHNLKNGVIKLHNKDGEQYQTIEWTKGFVERAEWVLPDTESDEQRTVYMEYTIVASKVAIGGIEMENPWQREYA